MHLEWAKGEAEPPFFSRRFRDYSAWIEDLEEFLSRNYHCERRQDEIVFTSRKIPRTEGSIRSIHNRPGKPGWILVFTMYTETPRGFLSGDRVVIWFDDARAEIHGLVDLIVPEEIVKLLM